MPTAGAMLENATLFLVYNQVQSVLRQISPPPLTLASEPPHLSIPQLAISAALAGASASFVLTPVELVKCKMQVQALALADAASAGTTSSSSSSSGTKAPGPLSITRSILARDGVKGLWLGQTGTLIRETGGSAAWFTTFELLSTYCIQRRHNQGQRTSTGGRITRGDLSAVELMGSGACAGVVFNCILFPADCIKSTIQTEDELRGTGKGNGIARRSFVQTGKAIYRARGIRGLYSGCGVTALRAAPSSALIFYM